MSSSPSARAAEAGYKPASNGCSKQDTSQLPTDVHWEAGPSKPATWPSPATHRCLVSGLVLAALPIPCKDLEMDVNDTTELLHRLIDIITGPVHPAHVRISLFSYQFVSVSAVWHDRGSTSSKRSSDGSCLPEIKIQEVADRFRGQRIHPLEAIIILPVPVHPEQLLEKGLVSCHKSKEDFRTNDRLGLRLS
ncbi:hypothetical protein C0Q70_10169 [Pomacea canaliculata]|uniref:Uncharacterized protein n=1 Tax=Pomacea canaliculata TaxID=400727 RepID=A0A2T7PBU8_POMCA|nr:hypothetical protein C0Q70_10169 [Pomacea canaliculata]